MSKIEKLQRIVETIGYDGTQVSRLPNNKEIIDKVNEIIDFLNRNVEKKNPFIK